MSDLDHIESLEIGQLDLRYAHTRIRRPEALLPLIRSLEQWGQIQPVSVVPSDPPCHILVDGYLRVEALRQCGKDMVLAEVWLCGEVEALLQVLMRVQERRWDALEQAALIRELHERHDLSQDRIAVFWERIRVGYAGNCLCSVACLMRFWRRSEAVIFLPGRPAGCWRRWRAPTRSMPRPSAVLF
jgi:hypothetical protein